MEKTIRTNVYLPDDIIAEILARLSLVKSLLKFKCLSKWWCSCISSDKFVDAYLENSRKNTTLAHHRAILISSTSQKFALYVVNGCQVGSLFTEQLIDVDQLEPEFNYPTAINFTTRIVGCCNGLCCILIDGKGIILWNPSTRKSHKLPTVIDTDTIHDDEACIQVAGFGYDEPKNDYKVLATCYLGCSDLLGIRLFSLKTNSWKTIDDFVGNGYFQSEGVLVNGKIHWPAWVGIYPDRGVKIVSFDLGSEASGLVELPSCAHDRHLELGVIEGCLSVLAFDKHGFINVWVMEVYGVKETWRKLVTFSLSDFRYEFIRPLCVSKEGEILFLQRFARSLFIYNSKDELVRHPKINIFEKIHQIGFYFQSLVSPFPDAEQKEHSKKLH